MKDIRKIAASLAGAVLLVGLVVGASLWAFGQMEAAAEARRQTFTLIVRAGDLAAALGDAETGQRGFALTGDEKFLEPYLAVREKIGGQLEELRGLLAEGASRKHLEALGPLVEAKLAVMAQTVELRRRQDTGAVLALVAEGSGKRLMDAIRAETGGFIGMQESELARNELDLQSDMGRLFATIIAASVLALLFALACAYLVYRQTRHQLQGLVLVETRHLLELHKETTREAQRALIALYASQDKLAVTLKSIGDAVIATDAQGHVTLLNPVAEQLTGWTQALAIDRPVEEVLRIVRQGSLQPGVLPVRETIALDSQQDLPPLSVLVARDGREHPIADSCAPIHDRGGEVIGAVLVFRDVTNERAAQQAVRDGTALIQTVLNTVADGVVTLRASDGVVETVNPAAGRMLGYGAAEVVGHGFGRLIPEFGQAQHNGPLEFYGASDAARAAGLGREVTGRHKNGAVVPLEIAVSEMWLKGERYFTAILRDITARRHAEEALVESGALQSAIFNSANFSSIATDAKGVIQIFNVGAERMLGYSAADVVNRITPADISDPDELIARATGLSVELGASIAPGFEALVFKASRGIEDIYELTYVRKDGSRFPAIVSVTALRDAQERIIGYLLIGTDNTARKEVEAAQALLDQRLRDQQFYTRSLIESNIDALMTTDPQGVISDVNQQMLALTGRTRDELIGAHCKNFFTDPASAESAIRRVLVENKVRDYELTVRAHNGEETVVSYNAATFHNRDRKLQGVFAAARDVTERKRFERALQEKNLELEHASRMKSEFLATMSHELRTPLNAIIGFSEALKDGLIGDLSDSQREYIGDIFTSGQHLLSLINDILDLSKVEAGMMALELEAVDVRSLLSDSLSIVKEKAAAQRIRLALEADDDPGIPQLDMRKIKQIVYNLLSNAVKFSARGGQVSVRARRVPRSGVGRLPGNWPVHSHPLADSEFQDFLEICVSDSGIGISTENMPKLFQAFSQIDSSLARRFEGTGLGLAMVKQLTELHGGSVAVSSAMGEGARFAVWLPMRAGTQAAPVALPANSATPVAEQRVALMVEDDDQAAELVRVLLEAEGFTVLRAASAAAALDLAPQQPLDLITLDLQLPGVDGWELLLQIREHGALARVPVVVFDGLADSNLALNSGAAAVLQKPISRAALKSTLEDLGLHPLHDQTRTVLVVDDDPKAVEVLAAFLPAPSYAVVRAYGGAEAIALAQQIRPDLILLDLMMPEVSGFDVVSALQRQSDTARIPILVVTAKQVTALDRAALNRAPGDQIRVVEKSGFNQNRFIAEVRRALAPR